MRHWVKPAHVLGSDAPKPRQQNHLSIEEAAAGGRWIRDLTVVNSSAGFGGFAGLSSEERFELSSVASVTHA